MLWKVILVMDERLRFVARLPDGEPTTDLCRALDISCKTGYQTQAGDRNAAVAKRRTQ